MPRRSNNTSTRRPRRATNRRLPLNKSAEQDNPRAEENALEMTKNTESDDDEDEHGGLSTAPTGAELIILDQEDADNGNSLGHRRRSDKASTPQRGLNKKKARFVLENKSDSEDEIVFEDSPSTENSKTSADSPPAPRRLCQGNEINDMSDDSQSQKTSSVSSVEVVTATQTNTPTMAERVTRNTQPPQPAAINMHKSCRYSAQLLVPPSAEPVRKASEALQNVFREIQRQAGKQVFLAAWQSREDNLVRKHPQDIPIGTTSDDRDIYTRLFDNYLGLAPDTEKRLYLKIHFITQSPDALKIPLKELGRKLEGLKERFGFSLNPNPNPCQSARVTTIGWGYGTVKAMNSDHLVQAVRDHLKIPEHVALGAQWRTIADEHGKRFQWPQDPSEPRPPQAIHFDIDDTYVGIWQPKFAKLWKKGANKKVNYLQIRLVPCFTTQMGKSLTPAKHRATKFMSQKQAHLVNLHTTRLTSANIFSLDTPIGENKVTLRRYLMMKAPEGLITDRIFISVDPSYRGNDYTLTVPKIYAEQGMRVLNNMIPECLHLYGSQAGKWFTNIGLLAYQDVKWDPMLNITTAADDDAADEMVEEHLFGMGSEWKDALPQESPHNTQTHIDGIGQLDKTVGEILAERAKRGIHDDTSSFGDVFGRSHSGSTIAPIQPPQVSGPVNRARRVGFRVENENATEARPTPTDDATVSTMGSEVTTGSTRRTLRHQLEVNESLRTQGAQIAEDRDRLQQMLEQLQEQMLRHGIFPPNSITHNAAHTPDLPSATRVPPSTEADSAGGST